MIFSFNDLVSIQEIIADVLLDVDDQEMQKLTPGWYRKHVKSAMDELSFDAPFIDVTKDIPMPDDMKIPVPKGVYQLDNIIIYAGTPDNIGYQENVYWKRNFSTRGRVVKDNEYVDAGYTANSPSYNVTDPFYSANMLRQKPTGAYFFNTHSGIIHLSDSCSHFDFVRLEFKGIASAQLDIDDIKLVPPFAVKAVTLWVVEKAARALKSTDTGTRRYRTIQNDASSQLDEYGLMGAWHEAKVRLAKIDPKKWRDLIEYNSKMTY